MKRSSVEDALSDQTLADGRLVLGLGCERGAAPGEVIALAEQVLSASGCSADRLAFIASLDSRRNEPALLAAAAYFAVPLRTFDAVTLEAETPRLVHPSMIVFAHTGCHGVAEAAALVGAGPASVLIVAKTKSAHATAAIAQCGSDLLDSNQGFAGVFAETESASLQSESSESGAP